MIVDRFPGRTLQIDDQEYLYFGGTSYLGLANHPDFLQIISKNLHKWGSFYGSSRNANVQLSVYKEVESFFANQVGTKDSVMVSSGTLAGKLVLQYFINEDVTFFHYPKAHPAILAEGSLPLFKNGNLHPRLLNGTNEEVIITLDAICGLEVTSTSFDFIEEISKSKKITLVVDESHSLGILGKEGQGILSSIPRERLHRTIMVASLGKAMSLAFGVIASDTKFIDQIKKEDDFVSSSGANPVYLQTYIDAQDLFKERRNKLIQHLEFVLKHLKRKLTLKFDQNYPVIYSNSETIFSTLLKEHIVITSFKYPTYKKPMNRMVITPNHTKEDLVKLIEILNHDK